MFLLFLIYNFNSSTQFIKLLEAFLCFVGKSLTEYDSEKNMDDLDIQLFDLPTITTATNDFSVENKIGEGGFGPVYKVIIL